MVFVSYKVFNSQIFYNFAAIILKIKLKQKKHFNIWYFYDKFIPKGAFLKFNALCEGSHKALNANIPKMRTKF